jgi:hypothetical protein
MKRPSTPEEKLERLVASALREQPLRDAPPALATRVLAEIARREQRTWWQTSFAHWPRPAQLVFVIVSLGFAAAGLKAAVWLTTPLNTAVRAMDLPAEVTWIQTLVAAIATAFASMPSLWVYLGIALLAGLYATLFSIGAAAYRTVYLRSQTA